MVDEDAKQGEARHGRCDYRPRLGSRLRVSVCARYLPRMREQDSSASHGGVGAQRTDQDEDERAPDDRNQRGNTSRSPRLIPDRSTGTVTGTWGTRLGNICARSFCLLSLKAARLLVLSKWEPTGIEPVTSCLQSRRSPI